MRERLQGKGGGVKYKKPAEGGRTRIIGGF
jgi:hypothetical protein